MAKRETIEVENFTSPGSTYRVDAEKHRAMKTALLKVLPEREPGMTVSELREAVLPHLPQDLFPGGAKAGWWIKSVQLDLEAKSVIVRTRSKPLRLHLA